MPDEPVSYEDLDAAADEIMEQNLDEGAVEDQSAEGDEEEQEGEVVEEGEEGEQAQESEEGDLPSEPTDNAERSALGRKVAAQGETLARIEQTLAEMVGNQRQPVEEPIEDGLDDLDDDTPLTKREVERLLENRERKRKDADTKYQNGYRNTLAHLGQGQDPELHAVIVEKMMNDYNIKHSDNPVVDAQLNYANARADVFAGLAAKKASPFPKKGEKEQGSQHLGGPSGNPQGQPRAKKKMKLDPHAQAYLDSLRMSDKDKEALVENALEGEAPMYIRRK